MGKSLLEELPKIVKEGRQEAERILEGLESRHRVRLQTREWVLPSKDVSAADWIAQAQRRARLDEGDGNGDWRNRLIYGDNLLAMAALLAGDEQTLSLRGKVDLIYIDPPFDSKADYRTKIALPGTELEQRPTVTMSVCVGDQVYKEWFTLRDRSKMIYPVLLGRRLLAELGPVDSSRTFTVQPTCD